MTRDTRSGGTPAAAPAPTRHEVLVNLRRALSVLDTVRANHESAARIGTLEALECIDRQDWDDAVDSLIAAARGVEAGALSGVAAWIRALPPDAIASVVNAYRDAYDAYLQASHVGATGVDAHAEGCRWVRDALLSLAPPEVAADGLTPAVRAANAKNEGKRAFDDGVADGMEPEDALDMALGVAVGLATDAVDELRRFAEGDTRPVPQTYMTAGAAAREAAPSGSTATFPRPVPMRDEDMPEREWTDFEWVCNQWYLANEHYQAVDAELTALREAAPSEPSEAAARAVVLSLYGPVFERERPDLFAQAIREERAKLVVAYAVDFGARSPLQGEDI